MQNTTLLLITQLAGIFLLLSTVFLLFFRRIYLDANTQQPIRFKLPIIGEFSTQTPVLALIVMAAFMVVYPISRAGPDFVTLNGHIETGGKSVSAVVVAVPDYQFDQSGSDDFSLKIPLLSTEATYRVVFMVDNQVIDDQQALPKKGRIDLKPVTWNPPASSPEDAIAPKKEVSDAELKALDITH